MQREFIRQPPGLESTAKVLIRQAGWRLTTTKPAPRAPQLRLGKRKNWIVETDLVSVSLSREDFGLGEHPAYRVIHLRRS